MHRSIASAALGSMRLSPSSAIEGEANAGQVVGDSEAALVGGHVLRDGGNAIDAIDAGSFLTKFVLQKESLAVSMAAPRIHTEGNLILELERNAQDEERAKLNAFGYQVKTAASATLNALVKEDGRFVAGMR